MRRGACLFSLLLFLVAVLASQGVAAYFFDVRENANNTFATSTWSTPFLHPSIGGLDPESGSVDKTGPKKISLNTTELAYLETSDDTWYEVQVGWPAAFDVAKRLDFRFPDIPANATVLGVGVTVEWAWLSNMTDPGAQAKLRVHIGEDIWQEYALTPPSTGYTDVTETVDLSDFLQTAADVNDLQVRFMAAFTSAPAKTIKTRHDLFQVMVNYH